MSIFSFVKEAGEKLINLLTPGNANAGEELKKHVQEVGLGNPNITATVDGDKVTVSGEVATQEEKEKSSWRRAISKAWPVLKTRLRSQARPLWLRVLWW
jgi:Putative phospholipid-binding domain.